MEHNFQESALNKVSVLRTTFQSLYHALLEGGPKVWDQHMHLTFVEGVGEVLQSIVCDLQIAGGNETGLMGSLSKYTDSDLIAISNQEVKLNRCQHSKESQNNDSIRPIRWCRNIGRRLF